MASREEYLQRTVAERLDRLARTPDELADAMRRHNDAELSRRPAAKHWSATDVVCHLRDIEELCMMRFRTMLAMNEPKVLVAGARPKNPEEWGLAGDERPVDPDRWADERQYARADPHAALRAFRARREDSLAFLGRLSPQQWRRVCLHPTLGRMTFEDWTAAMASHDDNHLNQLGRALAGRP